MKEKETNEEFHSLGSLERMLLVSIKFIFLFALNGMRTGDGDEQANAPEVKSRAAKRTP